MLMVNLINVTLNTLTIGLFCYMILSYYWALKLCIVDVRQAEMFNHGIIYLLLTLLAVLITIISAPITYTIYMFSTMININNAQAPVVDDEEEEE